MKLTSNLNELIDHTLLRPTATLPEIRQLCLEARAHRFCSVCIQPYWIADARQFLEGAAVKVCTVVAFPLGVSQTRTKVAETRLAVEAGAEEIDFVINVGAVKEKHFDFIEREIREIVLAAEGRTVKVILETCYLESDEIRQVCQRAVQAQAHFVKTSTGFGPSGATIEQVRLMRETVGCQFGVKASGGIRDRATAESMLAAGANRLGLSASLAILEGSPSAPAY